MVTLFFYWLTRGGQFLSVFNWQTIAVQTVILGITALGMTVIMIAGGIDLSVGSMVALVTVSIAMLAKGTPISAPIPSDGWRWAPLFTIQLPLAAAMFAGVLVGGLCGLFNGVVITGLRVVPFIITLGGLKIFRGLAKWVAGSTTVSVPSEAQPWWFDRVMYPEPTPSWLMVAPGVWILLFLSLLLAIVLRYSLVGRYIFTVGSNEATARLCGINVPLVKTTVYTLGGLATGLAGALQFVYLGAMGDPTTSEGLELQTIAAVVIGGGSLSGGVGTVLGTLIGCLIISVLNNGCVHAGITNAAQDVIIGLIIIAAVTLDQVRRRSAAAA
jgi:ribose/xylose/arabinose/galactoside ABC-type transport system permease subunit